MKEKLEEALKGSTIEEAMKNFTMEYMEKIAGHDVVAKAKAEQKELYQSHVKYRQLLTRNEVI